MKGIPVEILTTLENLLNKLQAYKVLDSKLSMLRTHKDFLFPLELDYQEQIKYAKIGLYSLWYDLNGKSKLYESRLLESSYKR